MRSKVFIICIIIYHSALSLFAQNKNDRFHEYGSERRGKINMYIGPLAAFSNIGGSVTFDGGATGGVIINNKFFIGLYGQKLLTNVPRTDMAEIGYPTFTDGRIKMRHYGGVLGYIHNTDKVWNWGVGGSAGTGMIELAAKGPTNKYEDVIYDDKVIIVIPKLFVEMKMTSWFKVNMGAGFRILGMMNGVYKNQAGETKPTFKQSEYTKPEFSISLLFGAFRLQSYLLR